MGFFKDYGPGDDAPLLDGDGGFLGVDMRRDPGQLEPGLAAEAWNIRFTDGVAAPRKGIRLIGWSARHEAGYGPGDIRPYGFVAGAGVFNDPITGYSWLIVVTSEGVFRARPGTTAAQIPTPVNEVIPDRVQLIQTYNGLVMLRGASYAPLYCDDLNVGFKALPEAVNNPGNIEIPPSASGVYFQNRLFVIDGRTDATHVDTVFVSDFGTVFDVLEGSTAYNSFKINVGSSDRLVALYRFNDTTLIAAKETSIYTVSQIYGTNEDLAANARLDAITTEYGCKAARSFVQVGSDVWFLAHRRGICSVRQTEQNKLQGVDVPVSRDIDPLIRRINWEHAANAVAATHDNKVYIAVPLDNATYNNTVLVYDAINGRWAGADQGSQLKVKEWLKVTYGGAVRLAFMTDDGFACLYEDGFLDHVGSASGAVSYESVRHRLVTRGYGGSIQGRKRFGQLRCRISTWWPRFNATAHVDGVQEGKSLGQVGPFSRTTYRRPHNATPWDASNANDDFLTPHREDYAIIPPSDGIETGDEGLQASLHQTVDKAWRLSVHGKYAQLEIEGTQGRTELRDAQVEMFRGSPRHPTQS